MKLKKVIYLTEEQFIQLVNGEIEGKTYNPEQEQYLIIDTIEDMFFRVYTTTTMNTSTLPAIEVPALTAEQVSQIQTAMSQGKVVTVDATHNGITNQMKVLESDHDGAVGGIRVTYYNNYVDYTLDGNQVTATYTPIGGSGSEKLYSQVVKFYMDDVEFGKFQFITTKSNAITANYLSYWKDFAKTVKKMYLVTTMQTGPNPDTDFIVNSATELLYSYDYDSSIFTFYPAGYKGTSSPASISFPTWVDSTLMKIEEV